MYARLYVNNQTMNDGGKVEKEIISWNDEKNTVSDHENTKYCSMNPLSDVIKTKTSSETKDKSHNHISWGKQ